MSENKQKPKILKEKEKLAVEYYTNPQSETYQSWTKSYQKAGYSLHKGWRRNAARVLNKSHIKAAIEKERANYKVKTSVSREYCVGKLQDIVETSDNERNCIAAMSLIGDFCGFKRESAPNAEREAAKQRRMTEEERKLAEKLANELNREAAGEGEVRTVKPDFGQKRA